MKDHFYITTPIYYVTDAPHIGHLYTTLACDIMARYQRLKGHDVHFLTGTDEHGQKIEKKAKETNETPQALADRVVQRYKDAWVAYGVEYNDFIRTTEERHKKVVIDFMDRLMKTGDIYLDEYEGWYCVPDEAFWTETQVVDGKCPDCGRPVEKLKEESYFFKMSAYVEQLKEHIKKNPDFILPESRKNEVLGFLNQDVRDISISRTTIQWGIPMPKGPQAKKDHKVYVWFDALTNYISALGLGTEAFEHYWKEAVHVVGKDILRFHAVYWPTFLMALKFPLPKQIVAHGWLTDSNRKISKSLGNAIDPIALAKEVGVDGMRYFLFREFVFGQDGEYTKQIMYTRINSDLANDFGNCVNRTINMLMKYFGDKVEIGNFRDADRGEFLKKYDENFGKFKFNLVLEQAMSLVSGVNRHIDATAPWKLAKDETKKEELKQVLLHCWNELRVATILLYPVIPTSAEKALEQLGVESKSIPLTQTSISLKKPEPLFPRLEMPKES